MLMISINTFKISLISVFPEKENEMTIAEQIKVLCVRCGVSEAELARRLGKTLQSLNAKIKRASFTVGDLDKIAKALGVSFKRAFILDNGEEV